MNSVERKQYYETFKNSVNAATASAYDANANVVSKGFSQWNAEAYKKDNYEYNMSLLEEKIEQMYGAGRRKHFTQDRDSHLIYIHDAKTHTGISPYCTSITMYPFLFNGLKEIDGFTDAPKHLKSFTGSFCNLIYALAAQFKGAIATPEFFTYFAYFVGKDYGHDWYNRLHETMTSTGVYDWTLQQTIEQEFQFVIYTINQEAGGRGGQAVFWNVAYFDQPFFESLFQDFVFPDGSQPNWEAVSTLQKIFMRWFNKERNKKDLTFPVETFNLITNKEGTAFIDEDSFQFACDEYADGHSFFTYMSDSVDSLASCCRLKNGIEDNTFSFTLGAGGIMTGSANVITINVNNLVQTHVDWKTALQQLAERITDYQSAYRALLAENINAGMFKAYGANFIALDKQYMTTGVNGFNQAAEYLGLECSDNDSYASFVDEFTTILYKHHKTSKGGSVGKMGENTEFVPAEGLGVNNLNWDREAGLLIADDETLYNSYFYRPEDPDRSLFEKIRMHGTKFTRHLDGGVAAHLNLEEHLTSEQYGRVLLYAAKEGCSYLTFNIPNTICNDCSFRSKNYYKDICPRCGSDNLDYLTRIIGYLRRISNFAVSRQKEAKERVYGNID